MSAFRSSAKAHSSRNALNVEASVERSMVRDTLGFWVWWNRQRRYIYERKGSRLLVEIEINGIGENLWVNASEVKPLTFEENQAFAAEVVQRYQKKLGRVAA